MISINIISSPSSRLRNFGAQLISLFLLYLLFYMIRTQEFKRALDLLV